jgi:large conductance mechanosensitive channel
MLDELRDFMSRGNIMDLAVAVIIGGAFTAIITALVDDIVMPVIGVLLGGLDFTTLSIQIGEATVAYGNFIQATVNFLLISVVIFFMIRAINHAQELVMGEEEEETPTPPEPTEEVELLTEIRDLLKERG